MNSITHDSAARESAADFKDLLPFEIPAEFGSIREFFLSPEFEKSRAGYFYVLIEDAHGNLSAQKNIYEITRHLVSAQPEKPLVLLEGAVGTVDTSLVSRYPDQKVKERVANRLFNNGQIDGIELLNINEMPDLKLMGIEEPKSYSKNLEAAFAVVPEQNRVLGRLEKIDRMLTAFMPYVCSSELTEVLAHIAQNREANAALPDYLSWLMDKAKKHTVPLGKFPELTRLFSEKDRDAGSLLLSLDQAALISEIRNLEEDLVNLLIKNTREKSFVRVLNHFRLLERAVAMKLDPDEARYFLKFTDEFKEKVFLGYLKRGKRFDRGKTVTPGSDALLPALRQFYEQALRRDHAMKEKMQKRMSEERTQTATVITGGFHTDGIAHFLREEGASYVVITPQVSDHLGATLYRNSILRFLNSMIGKPLV
ncbi:MAG: hypothetical protein HY587_03245 [Candidatus Omnitrophica bacterium]|nr:hypothetical protein [Candidatus Omnitrophota bacterium]